MPLDRETTAKLRKLQHIPVRRQPWHLGILDNDPLDVRPDDWIEWLDKWGLPNLLLIEGSILFAYDVETALLVQAPDTDKLSLGDCFRYSANITMLSGILKLDDGSVILVEFNAAEDVNKLSDLDWLQKQWTWRLWLWQLLVLAKKPKKPCEEAKVTLCSYGVFDPDRLILCVIKGIKRDFTENNFDKGQYGRVKTFRNNLAVVDEKKIQNNMKLEAICRQLKLEGKFLQMDGEACHKLMLKPTPDNLEMLRQYNLFDTFACLYLYLVRNKLLSHELEKNIVGLLQTDDKLKDLKEFLKQFVTALKSVKQ